MGSESICTDSSPDGKVNTLLLCKLRNFTISEQLAVLNVRLCEFAVKLNEALRSLKIFPIISKNTSTPSPQSQKPNLQKNMSVSKKHPRSNQSKTLIQNLYGQEAGTLDSKRKTVFGVSGTLQNTISFRARIRFGIDSGRT